MQAFHQALRQALRSAGLAESSAAGVEFSGSDPVYRTPYKVSTAGAAALGAMAIAMADIRALQTGTRPAVAIDVHGATASLRSSKYVRVDGNPPPRRKAVTGFYPATNGRWNYFHCNHLPHEQALLRVLGVPADKARVAAAAAGWDAFALETAVHEAGGLAPVVRTPEEWQALPNTRALEAEPLVDIRKTGDSAPTPLPQGGGRALSGLKVLDLTRVLAGPTCARLLAESGADVLKITCPRHPDSEGLEWDTGYGKRRLTLDIATPDGKAAFAELVKGCDVLSQAYRPGALAGLGFGPDQARALRPGIVYVSLNAYGYTGDWNMRRGFDTAVQSASGMAYVSGRGQEPQFTPVSALDYIAGYLMTFGALVALRRRHEEGGSYAVNVSLARCAQWLASMGLHDTATVWTGADEFPAIGDWLIDVPTPLGTLRRLRPIVRYTEQAMNELIAWNRALDAQAAAWSS
ncbi:CoA transferase [Pigmentiphaga soli]|uniref:CoA transferase n=2 Tax=Pigmentiphaga soli TaxID=1007095 RepID=A0ABP8H894_9BURK